MGILKKLFNKELKKLDNRIDNTLKEVILLYKTLHEIIEDYNEEKKALVKTIQLQDAANRRLYKRVQDILDALALNGIKVPDEDRTLH